MPLEATTLNGGGVLYTNLSTAQTAKAVGAIASLVNSVTPSQVDYYPGNPTPNLLTDITSPPSGNAFTVPPNATGDQIIAVATNNSQTIDLGAAPSQNYVIIGNDAGDAFNLGGLNATLVTGSGADTISMPGGTLKLEQGGGNDTINASGNTTINQTGTGALTIDLSSGTIHLGTTDGNDTINATGSATVVGGTGAFTFNGGAGASSTVYTGTGNETLFGGSGAGSLNNFYGQYDTNPNSTDSLVGGGAGATNNFFGGQGSDTMVSGAGVGAAHDTFTFQYQSSVQGGNDLIQGFTTDGRDQLVLQGYNPTFGIAGYTHSAAGTDITLQDGTQITVSNVDLGNENQAIGNGFIVFK